MSECSQTDKYIWSTNGHNKFFLKSLKINPYFGLKVGYKKWVSGFDKIGPEALYNFICNPFLRNVSCKCFYIKNTGFANIQLYSFQTTIHILAKLKLCLKVCPRFATTWPFLEKKNTKIDPIEAPTQRRSLVDSSRSYSGPKSMTLITFFLCF